MTLEERFSRRAAPVAVIGQGYVGLPLAVEFAKVGFPVYGIDLDERKIARLKRGDSYIQDVPSRELRPLVKSGLLRPTTDFSVLKRSAAVSICVPTPLSKTKDPDMSFVVAASEQVAKYLHKDMAVILESTTYPGTTDELLLPMMEKTGLKVGKDFFLAFSPERVDPGNPKFLTKNTPKVIGGITPRCTQVVVALYSHFLDNIVPVSSTRVAEMVKLLENTFRSVNIGLVNETALMCERLGIDVWEVIDGAATKPFGFMPFYPGPGLGGHCIPIDPFYLAWKARSAGFSARFIELAGEINGNMPRHVARRVVQGLNRFKKGVNGSRVLVLGVAYKPDIEDVRESPAFDVMELLREMGARVDYSDPLVPAINFLGARLKSVALTPARLRAADCVVVTANHKQFDYDTIYRNARLIIDTRNAFKGRKGAKVIRL
jgi:UDP-N-acetyl-D-glucosamine dehydrogenase